MLANLPNLLYNLLAMNTNYTQLGFVLGRDSALSVAEIFALLSRKGIEARTLHFENNILITEIDGDSGLLSIDELGGTIKLFEILGEYKDIADVKAKLLEVVPFESEKRINFGVSGYGKLSKKVVLNLGYEIKESILDAGYKSRFVTGKSIDLSSVIVHENKLIERGFEAILIRTRETLILGRTISVQDYKAYSKRDFGRPQRDDRNGMLPPKLAQIMINLAKAPEKGTIYDPFCGSGTVLQEALLLGYQDVYGSDISERNVADTKENLEWLLRHCEELKATRQSLTNGKDCFVPRNDEGIFVSDVLTPSREIQADAIVGEGFLGEPYRRNSEQAAKDVEKLVDFYVKALTNLREQLRQNGQIVLAIPFFIVGSEYFYLPIIDKLPQIGLQLAKPNIGEAELRLFGRGNLTYSRADQFVGREILILKKG